MPPQLERIDKEGGETEEEDEEEDDEGVNPYRAEMEAKARVVMLRDKALAFWNKDEWESIMNMYTNEAFFDTLLCWIRPTRDFLSFLHSELRRLQVTRIVSVGCGCGFLEWLIKRACSGIEVVGYEVDRAWWQGRYGVKPFIEHIYIDEVKTRHVPEGSVLMTCYFHSVECWRQYLAEFRGDILIVIGPHTNDHLSFPEPRHMLSDPRFVLESQREIAGGDMIVVLRRNPELWPVPPPPPVPASGPEELPSVKPPQGKVEQAKRYSEMRRTLVMERICNAKQNPKTEPPNPKVRQGPALQSTYTTRKPSLAFSLGSFSVASRLNTLNGAAPGGIKRSVSCSARLETMGLGPDTKPAPRRKTTAPAGSGQASSRSASARSSGAATPDGRARSPGGQRLAVDAAFGGRPLRESRSVPSLATLKERQELEVRRGFGDERDAGQDGEQQRSWKESLNRPHRRSGAVECRESTGHEGGRKMKTKVNRRTKDEATSEVGGEAAQKGRRQQTKLEDRQRNSSAEVKGRDAEDNHYKMSISRCDDTTDIREDETLTNDLDETVRLPVQEGQAQPPLVTVTDLSEERRDSLRRPSWSLFSDSAPSR